jgi:malonate-semialdehyde dehydrogenase (acetylating) / methylmalonate-semialdehyde dehydrogenase
MSPVLTEVGVLKNYIGGRWVDADATGHLEVTNPSTGEAIAEVPLSTRADVDRAVAAAAEAYRTWGQTPAARRVAPLFKLVELLREDEEKIARVLTAENGKSLVDARAELKRAFENIEVACGMPMLQQGDKLIGASYDIDGEVIRLPMGVFGMIAPFNFPAMVPFWFIPYAIATGNTFVLKPSEQVPMTMQLITRYMEDAGIPPGVFNLVNGDATAATALIDNPAVEGVSVVGSSRTARMVAERCAQRNKRSQAMGGAKNHLVVMPDARMEHVIRNMTTSCYGCAGQRCMASSVIVAVGEHTYQETCERFIEDSRNAIVANPLDPGFEDEPMLVGPVISAAAKERILGLIDTAVREGATLALDGREFVVEGSEGGYFVGPTVLTDVQPGSTIHNTEVFGPVVVIMKAESFDDALAIVNGHEYGNGASVYTQSGFWARRFKLEAQAGMIGVNVGIPAPVAHLPFGGMKASQWADIKTQGKAVVHFYTQDKIVTERYFPE